MLIALGWGHSECEHKHRRRQREEHGWGVRPGEENHEADWKIRVSDYALGLTNTALFLPSQDGDSHPPLICYLSERHNWDPRGKRNVYDSRPTPNQRGPKGRKGYEKGQGKWTWNPCYSYGSDAGSARSSGGD